MPNISNNRSKNILNASTAFGLVSAIGQSAFAYAAHSTQPPATITSAPQQIGQRQETTQETVTNPGNYERPPVQSGHATPSTKQHVGSSPRSNEADELSPIIVTGSHIRGKVAAGANLEIYDARTLEQSGYATVQDFFQVLPQNFQGGGGSEDPSAGDLRSSNQLGGSSINLRGLGADSTLILINGRRVPASGLSGNFVDISTIPQTAIERIELLADGASALYGSDAVGGVVNFILRKDFDGAESRFRYGRSTSGGVDEYRAAQVFGRSWSSGNALVSYEYYERDPLKYHDRHFTRTADLRPRGGEDYRHTFSNPGNILDPTTFMPAYAIPANQNGRSLTIGQLIPNTLNFWDINPGSDLLPRQRRHSIYLTAEQEINSVVSTLAELRFSERKSLFFTETYFTTLTVPETNPFLVDPFNVGYAEIDYDLTADLGLTETDSRVRTYGATIGTNIDFNTWRWETHFTYGREESKNQYDDIDFQALTQALADPDPNTAFNPFGDGSATNPATLAKLLQPVSRRPISNIINVNSLISGPITTLNGRDISLAVGLDYRNEKFSYKQYLADFLQRRQSLSRNIYAAFGEIHAPLVSPTDQVFGVRSLDLSLAGRAEKYSDGGTTYNPRVGVSWHPVEGLRLNATYAESFRAPNLIEQSDALNGSSISVLPDPASPTGRTRTLVLSGNNPNMDSETAETWTIGIEVQPSVLPGFKAKATYFDTIYTNRIARPDSLATILGLENRYRDIITRNPPPNLLAQLCNQPIFRGNPAACTPELVKAVVDFRLQNMAASSVRGIDVSINYSHDFFGTSASIGARGTHLIDYKFKQSPLSPYFETVDTLANPVDLRAQVYASAAIEGASATVILNYTDSYKNPQSERQNKINSFTTLDLTIGVRLSRELKIDKDGKYQANLSITNIFADSPPFADNGLGYDASNADPLGRVVSLEAKIIW